MFLSVDAELKRALLYWDAITIPSFQRSWFGWSPGPDSELLRKEGAWIDTNVQLSAEDSRRVTAQHNAPRIVSMGGVDINPVTQQYGCLKLLSEQRSEAAATRSEVDWSVMQTGDHFYFPQEDEGVDEHYAEISLLSCLPSPGPQTPIQEILEFKTKRRDELLRFRTEIDVLKERILNASDQHGELIRTKEQVELSIRDLASALSESPIGFVVDSMRIAQNIPKALSQLAPSLVGAAGAYEAGMPVLAGFAGGLFGGAVLKLVGRRQRKLAQLRSDLRNYVYLNDINTNLSGLRK